MSEPKLQGKSYDIPKQLVWDAWLKVKRNGGAAGADGVTIEQFEERLKDRLYKLWNRMSVSYTHLRAHETRHDLVCRLLLEKKKKKKKTKQQKKNKKKKKKKTKKKKKKK